MSINTSTSWSHSISLDMSTSAATEDQWAAGTTSLDVGLAVSSSTELPPNTGDEAALALATDATAVGEETLALTEVEALVAAGDYGSIITADVLVLGAAIATDGDIAYTDTNVSLETGYANFICLLAMDLTDTATNGMISTSLSTSELNLLSVTGLAAPPSPADTLLDTAPLSNEILDTGPITSTDGPLGWGDNLAENSTNFKLQGNLAIAEVSADAIGFDSLIDISADVLTIEDQMSMIFTQVLIAAG